MAGVSQWHREGGRRSKETGVEATKEPGQMQGPGRSLGGNRSRGDGSRGREP
jgi:large exoprotein involved in heme utilization and adhesion